MRYRLGGWLVSVAAAMVILGVSIAPFLLPPVVRFEQDRTNAEALTGFPAAELDRITGSILADLVLWQGDFDVEHEGLSPTSSATPDDRVLDAAERSHMRDVRTVFTGLWAIVLAGALVLALAFRRSTSGTEARFAAWRAVRRGAAALAILIAVAGVFAVVAFDAAFEVFHRLFFSAGTYTFDPATSKLVQLFPDQFWFEVSMAVGTVVFVLSIVVAWIAGRRLRHAASAGSMRTVIQGAAT